MNPTCPTKLYINASVDIPITIEGVWTEISVVIISNRGVEIGQYFVDMDVEPMTFRIPANDIPDAGIYRMRIYAIDGTGETRRLTPCPETIRFYE